MIKKTTAAPAATNPIDDTHPTDRTDLRIRAYLDSIVPIDDPEDGDLHSDGLRILERLACSADGAEEPSLQLSLADCQAVLYLMQTSQPRNPSTAFIDPEDDPSHVVGYYKVLNALADGIQRARERVPAMPFKIGFANGGPGQPVEPREVAGYTAAANLSDGQVEALSMVADQLDNAQALVSAVRERLNSRKDEDPTLERLVMMTVDQLCNRADFAEVVTGRPFEGGAA
jgi:hypothetical protein